MTSEGEAVSALATTAGKAIDALRGLGGYAAEVLGDVPKDLVKLAVGNRIKARCIASMQDLGLLAIPHLESIDGERISEPSPSVMIPLIAAAATEERAELRDLWARLLANATIDGGWKVRREFFETVAKMEPADAVLFRAIYNAPQQMKGAGTRSPIMRDYLTVQHSPPFAQERLDLLLDALTELRCIRNDNMGNISRYGVALMEALTVE